MHLYLHLHLLLRRRSRRRLHRRRSRRRRSRRRLHRRRRPIPISRMADPDSADGRMRFRYNFRRKSSSPAALPAAKRAKPAPANSVKQEPSPPPVDPTPTTPRRHPPSARVSAVRDYPSGCGRLKRAAPDSAPPKIEAETEDRRKVREARAEFDALYRELLQTNPSADVLAWKAYKERNKEVAGFKHVGSVPGVEIGDVFGLRVEMCVAGVHCQHRQPLDFVQQDGVLVAVSLVYSREYAEGVVGCDVIDYTSSGDFKLPGNLALKNSMETRTPVRIIFGLDGHPLSSSPEARKKKKTVMYVYDGVFLVDNYWKRKGGHGTNACLFQFKRLSEQAEIELKRIKSMEADYDKNLVMRDISQGEEKMPIPVVNAIDDELPVPFKYTKMMRYPPQHCPPPPVGCDCIDGCSDSESCACAVKNGGEITFNATGDIVEAKPLVYECGPSCKCPPSCHNRIVQNGIKFRLEVFKTESRGWGVRSRDPIPQGRFICEYTGRLLDDKLADRNANDEYLFDIGENLYDKKLWEGLRTSIPDLERDVPSEDDDIGFAVDALEYGNVGRFINHSCTPNLFAQNLLFDHHNKKMPHIALFAQDDIEPMQELTYDYNYAVGKVGPDGNTKKKDCYCGSRDCTGRMY